mmetsp:Transcript_16463/g.27205  ORF Transcript_16463/g.27205 Transcript_16463/m.27205 type:complete len:367 (+) Transcript_16463:397-1497(+)
MERPSQKGTHNSSLDEAQRLKDDLETLPEGASLEDYESVPVGDFGLALLRGMGYVPGKPIGLNATGLVKPIEFVPRHSRLGLGADPKPPEEKTKRFIKPGESRNPKPMFQLAPDADGRQRHVKTANDKLVELKPTGFFPGNTVLLIKGNHADLLGRILEVEKDNRLKIRLDINEEDVIVPISHAKPVQNHHKESSEKVPRYSPSSANGGKRQRTSSGQEQESKEHSLPLPTHSSHHSTSLPPQKPETVQSWLCPRIRVRINSRTFQNGKHYNKKAEVLDVIGLNQCVLRLDSGVLLEGVGQEVLETVIPKPGSKVLLVSGAGKGSPALLLECDKNKNHGIVQIEDDLSVISVTLDDIAESVVGIDG